MRGWIKKSESFTEDFTGKTGSETYAVLPLASLKSKTRTEHHHQSWFLFPWDTCWGGEEAEIAHDGKASAQELLKTFLLKTFWRSCPHLPEPTLGRGQRCLAGDLSKGRWRWRGRFASTKEHHGVKSHLQCYLTFPVPVVFLVLRQSWGLCKMKCATSKLPPALGRTLTTLWKAKFTVGRTSVHAFFGYSMVFLKITTSFHNFIISWINFTISYSCYPNHFPSPHPQETRPMNSSIWGNSPISEKWKEKLTYFLLMLSYEGKKEM